MNSHLGRTKKLSPWKILVVDDDADVHAVTRLALRGTVFRGRELEFIDAYSGAEALRCLDEHPDIAVAFVDIIMETDDAGLGAVRKIREKGHRLVRLIVRTGHPGQAPERDVIVNYDIHDYKEKSGITTQKLFTAVISALRAYDDLVALENHRRGLMGVLESVSWFDFANVQRYVAGMLAEFSSLAQLASNKVVIAALLHGETIPRVVAINGEWADIVEGDFPPFLTLPTAVTTLVQTSLDRRESLRSEVGETMMVFGHGVDLVAYASGEDAFANADRLLLEVFLLKVCQAVANQRLFQGVSDERDALLRGIAEYAERWDSGAEAHLDGVARYAQAIAARLETSLVFGEQIDARFVQNMAAAARLHDLGNISLPPGLLRKPEALSAEEQAQMRGHVAAGLECLASLKLAPEGSLTLAAEVIAGHHEYFDGSGYPQGLQGDAIPLAGRIVAVADAWMAMTAPRPYRPALTPEAARAEIMAGAGRQFDRRVVEALLFVLDQAV